MTYKMTSSTTVFIFVFILGGFAGSRHGLQAATLPTVVVVIDDTIVTYNTHLPQILEQLHKYYKVNGESQVQFRTIISQNETDTKEEICSYLKSGVTALMDMSSPRLAPLIKSACMEFGIPYISVVDRSYYAYSSQREDTEVMIEPAAVRMLRVVADIAVLEDLDSIAIFYDGTFDIQNTPRRVLTNVPAQHVYIHLSDNETALEANIKTIIKIDIKTIFIIANRFSAQTFLDLLSETKSTNFHPNIFVLTKDAKFYCAKCSENVLLITAQARNSVMSDFIDYMRRSGIATDFELDKIKVDEALAYDIGRLLTNAVSQISGQLGGVYDVPDLDCNNVQEADNATLDQSLRLAAYMEQNSISGVFGPLSWNAKDDTIRYDLTLLIDKVEITNGIQTMKIQVGNWTEATHVEKSVTSLITSDKRKNYRVVIVTGLPPFVYKPGIVNGTGERSYKGYCIELLELIANDMQFDYTTYDVDVVGSMDENGQWSGAIKELIDGNADIAVGPISVMAERENVIDFTVPYYDLVGLTILMKKPGFDYSLVKFLSVLDEEVWGCIIAAFVLFSVLISIFDKLSPFSYQNRRDQWKGSGNEPRVFTLKEGVWFCMMSLTPQGGGETPKALSGRLIAATWWLFGFIIIATYTANLAAFLTVSRLETPIDSLDDLSKQFKVQYAPVNGSMAMIYFKRMADIENRFYGIWKNMSLNDNLAAVERAQLAVWDYPVSDKYTKLWENMIKSGLPENNSVAIKRVLEEDFAYISDATSNRYETLINCQLEQVGEEFSRKPYALAVQDGSPLRNELSNTILKLINQRALEELKNKWWEMDKQWCPKIEDESDGISIRNIGGVFLVIVIGSGLSLITLAFECYWYRIRPDRKKRLQNVTSQTQLTRPSSTITANNNADQDNHNNTKKEYSRPSVLNGLDAGFSSTGFELSETGRPGLDTGFVNAGFDYEFEHTERF